MRGYRCFETSLANVSASHNCNCPIDCDSVSYSYSIVSIPINPVAQCPSFRRSKSWKLKSIFKEFYIKPSPPMFIQRVRSFLNITATSDEAELCKRLLPYRAEVTFRMATDTVSVTVRSKRLTFFDKLSAFGMLNSLT